MSIDKNIMGFTRPGLNSINGLNKTHLSKVKILLQSIRNAGDYDKAIKAIMEYELLNVPKITKGIYSPWLYYLQPTICPIINSGSIPFLTNDMDGWKGINEEEKYIQAMKVFKQLKEYFEETDLGFIDRFATKKYPRPSWEI